MSALSDQITDLLEESISDVQSLIHTLREDPSAADSEWIEERIQDLGHYLGDVYQDAVEAVADDNDDTSEDE